MRELHAAERPFPDVPVAVLSAAAVLGAAGGFPFLRRFRAHWTSLQAGIAASAPQGRHVVVDGSGHNIPRDRPDVVADAILTVAAQVRAGLTARDRTPIRYRVVGCRLARARRASGIGRPAGRGGAIGENVWIRG